MNNVREDSIWKGVAAGAIGGLAASYAMGQFHSLWSKASSALFNGNNQPRQSNSESEDSTVKTAEAISEKCFSHKLTSSEKKWAGPAVHYGFGTVMGAAYGALAHTVPASRTAYGTLYGAAVWLGADEIGVPAAGLSKPPTDTPVSEHVNELASHLVYGLVTDLVRRGMLKVFAAE